MSDILELYGIATHSDKADWNTIAHAETCPFLNRKCLKIRKSAPDKTIGTCSVIYGKKASQAVIVCPHRLLERQIVFTDCLHLLHLHEPGNELHIVSEITIPGGDVDYFLVSVKHGRVVDFVGIELQTLDTTGTVWPIRQKFLAEHSVPADLENIDPMKKFGINWKMTAKTILVQLHHKVQTFESLGKHLTLVIQDSFLNYLQRQFKLDHLNAGLNGDSLHIHSYGLSQEPNVHRLQFLSRYSTDANGIASALGLQANPNLELEDLFHMLEAKLNDDTVMSLLS